MADILSQSEIDALLSAISTGEMDANDLKKEEEKKREKVYDFRRALRFSKDHFRSLSRIHENFARLLTSLLSTQLRTYVQITVASVDQLPYEEFVRSVPAMTVLNVFESAPLEGRMVIEVNPNIAYAMLDRMLGGFGAGMNKIDNLTEIESKLISQLFEKFLEPFKEAWSSVVDIDPEMQAFEINTQFLQMASPNDTVVVISLSTAIGETSGMMNVCIPHLTLEPILSILSSRQMISKKHESFSEEDAKKLESQIKWAPITLKAILGEATLTIDDVLELGEDDVIPLNRRLEDPLVVKVEESPKFLAQPGKKNQHLAVQIMEIISEGDDENE